MVRSVIRILFERSFFWGEISLHSVHCTLQKGLAKLAISLFSIFCFSTVCVLYFVQNLNFQLLWENLWSWKALYKSSIYWLIDRSSLDVNSRLCSKDYTRGHICNALVCGATSPRESQCGAMWCTLNNNNNHTCMLTYIYAYIHAYIHMPLSSKDNQNEFQTRKVYFCVIIRMPDEAISHHTKICFCLWIHI